MSENNDGQKGGKKILENGKQYIEPSQAPKNEIRPSDRPKKDSSKSS